MSVSGDGGYNEVVNGVKQGCTRGRCVPSWQQGTPMTTGIGANDIEDSIAEAYRRTADLTAAGELKDEGGLGTE